MARVKQTAETVTIRGWTGGIGVTTHPIATEHPIVIAAHIIGGTGSRTNRTIVIIVTTMGTTTAPAADYRLGRPRQAKLAAGIPSALQRVTLIPARQLSSQTRRERTVH